MPRMIAGLLLLLILAATGLGADKKKNETKTGPCLPQPIKQTLPKLPKQLHRNVMFSFDVDEQGDVSNVKLTQGSGDRKIDHELFEKVKLMKFKERPGCGVFRVPLNLSPSGL